MAPQSQPKRAQPRTTDQGDPMPRLLRLGSRLSLLWAHWDVLVPVWRHPETPNKVRVLLVGVVLYLLFPMDVVSELLPLLGLADDATVAVSAVALAKHWTPEAVLVEARQKALLRRRRARKVLLWLLAGLVVWGLAIWAAAALLL